MDDLDLKLYVAYCPSCGTLLDFGSVHHQGIGPAGLPGDMATMRGTCRSKYCKGRYWSFLFEIDKSGTFGVMSFQCDNEDRV